MLDSYKAFKAYLQNKIKPLNNKPSLLLHTCCAPCSSATIELLNDYFNITIFYSNDNIYPFEEFKHRLDEQIRFAKNYNIDVIYDEYCNEDYNNKILGNENLGERSQRCYLCYELRLRKTAIKARELGFLYSDFKKEEGYKKSIKLSSQYNLYRQDYCGCIYSKKERDEIKCQER